MYPDELLIFPPHTLTVTVTEPMPGEETRTAPPVAVVQVLVAVVFVGAGAVVFVLVAAAGRLLVRVAADLPARVFAVGDGGPDMAGALGEVPRPAPSPPIGAPTAVGLVASGDAVAYFAPTSRDVPATVPRNAAVARRTTYLQGSRNQNSKGSRWICFCGTRRRRSVLREAATSPSGPHM